MCCNRSSQTGAGAADKKGRQVMASDMNTRMMDQRGKNFRINGDRLWDSLMEMAKIGPGVAGGNNRQTLTDEDAKGRRLYQAWCEAEGLEMGLDKMGTMFARREGTDPSLPPVMVGSHLDTQPTGGKYDGVLGAVSYTHLTLPTKRIV